MLWCIMLMIIADMMLITQKTAVLLYVMDIPDLRVKFGFDSQIADIVWIYKVLGVVKNLWKEFDI